MSERPDIEIRQFTSDDAPFKTRIQGLARVGAMVDWDDMAGPIDSHPEAMKFVVDGLREKVAEEMLEWMKEYQPNVLEGFFQEKWAARKGLPFDGYGDGH